MRKLAIIGLLLLLPVVVGAGMWGMTAYGKTATKTDAPSSAAEVMSDAGVQILRRPAKVEFLRIKPELSDDGDAERVEGYPVVATGRTPGDAAGRLRAVLLDDDSYLFGTGKGCILRPGVAVRVTGERNDVLNLVLCYECQTLIVAIRDAAGKELHKSGGLFDPAEAALVELAKAAFPDDKDIQALQDEGN